MSVDVRFPSSVRFESLCQFSSEIGRLARTDTIRFQTSHVRHFTPTSMLFLAKICRERSRKFTNEQIAYVGLQNHTYANNLGFSDALDLEGRPFPQRAYGGSTYIPLSFLLKAQLEETSLLHGIEIGDAIQLRAEDISEVVSQRRDQVLQVLLANSFREIFRNTFEHANASGAGFCAQYWPTRDEVEICISDSGIGISSSLIENKYLPELSDIDAIKLALMPGVSSKAWRHKKKRAAHRTDWDNSGYGLFFAHRLFGQLGQFGIASGRGAVWIERGKPAKLLSCNIVGTLVSMRLNLSRPEAISSCLAEIRADASRIKARLGTRSISIASVDSYLRGETP